MKLEEYAERLKGKTLKAPKNQDLRDWNDHPNWDLFENWVLEIGCGVGLHPILYSGQNPQVGMVALERTVEKFQKFAGRLNSHERGNLIGLHGDGLEWLLEKRQEIKARFKEIYLLYPNPYPKNNQRNKRYFGMPSFSLIIEALGGDGEIIMRSNERTYLDEAIYLAQEVWCLEKTKDQLIEKDSPQSELTHFERKYLARNLECWEIRWRKKS